MHTALFSHHPQQNHACFEYGRPTLFYVAQVTMVLQTSQLSQPNGKPSH
jgi:hypothetical protein